jgi:hypothetical protein
MTIRAVELQGGRHDPHRLHEIVDGNPFKHLDVLEDLFRQEGFVWCGGLGDRQPGADQRDSRNPGGRERRSSGP